ncbi:MAG: response regulator [Geobacter sp.]|nr:response regulator [Geobacter sp.]
MSTIAPLHDPSLHAERVMVVDDEKCIRGTMYELLLAEGIRALLAAGSSDCLRYLRNGFRGVILMDVMMPGKDGWETIRMIENEGLMNGNLISMLTAMDVPDSRMEGLQEVVVDYITKPFEPAELIASVRRSLALLACLDSGD